MKNKIIEFVKKYSDWILLGCGMGLFLMIWPLFWGIAFVVGYTSISINNAVAIIDIIILMWIIKGLWNLCYSIQDDVWYHRQYLKTGDDFEHRYCKCSCGRD